MNKTDITELNFFNKRYHRQLYLIAGYVQNREVDKAISEFRRMVDIDFCFDITFRKFFRFLIAEDRFEQIIPETKRIMKRLDECHKEYLHTDFSARGFVAEVYMILYVEGIKFTVKHQYSKAKNIFKVAIKSLSLADFSPGGVSFFKKYFNGLYLYNFSMEILETDPYKAFFILFKASKYLEFLAEKKVGKEAGVWLEDLAKRLPLYDRMPVRPTKKAPGSLNEIKKQLQKQFDDSIKKLMADKRLKLVGEKAEYEIWDIRGKKPVFKKAVEDLKNRNKKGSLDIFVDEDSVVYFGGEKVNELKKTQILYDFLLYFLKNKGIGGTYRELFVNVWEKGDVSVSFTMNKYKKGNVIRMKNRLNTLLKDYEIKGVVYEYSKYRFPEDLEFCVIEKYIYEGHNQNQ